MMFADTTPNPYSLFQILLFIAFFVGIGAGLATIGVYFIEKKRDERKRESREQKGDSENTPRSPRFSFKFWDDRHKEHDGIIKDQGQRLQKVEIAIAAVECLQEQLKDYEEKAKDSRGKMHVEIGEAKEDIASLKTSAVDAKDRINSLDKKIDEVKKEIGAIPSELIATLKNAGALK